MLSCNGVFACIKVCFVEDVRFRVKVKAKNYV